MSDTTVIIAISIIVVGFFILVALAIWLAVDRQRHTQQAQTSQSFPQSGPQLGGSQRAGESPPPANQTPAPVQQPAAQPAMQSVSMAPQLAPASPSSPVGKESKGKQHDPTTSGEYPSAELYDQTLFPEPPRRRSRKTQ